MSIFAFKSAVFRNAKFTRSYSTRRLLIKIAYRGDLYNGVDRTGNSETTGVIDCIDGALNKLSSSVDNEIRCTISSRTDSGVHASCNYLHVDMPAKLTTYEVIKGGNFHLGKNFRNIRLIDAWHVPDDFHCRFNANNRIYNYSLFNTSKEAGHVAELFTGETAWVFNRSEINVKLMSEALGMFVGTHDFTLFRGQGCYAKSPIKTIDS